MRRTITSLSLMLMVLLFNTGSARGQFDPGYISVRPEFGLGMGNTFGVTFGGALNYDITETVAVGPFFSFSTAGRSWKTQGQEQTLETKGSNSMAFGGRIYYLVTPDSDYPWYVNGGAGVVRFGSVSEWDDGTKIQAQVGGQVEELEIKGATRMAVNFGTGTLFPIGDDLTLVIDANSYIGGQGDRKGKSQSQDDLDLNELFEGGTFWLLHFTVGLSFYL